jgi:hypothetical protein
MEFTPVLADAPAELAAIRVNAGSFREASLLIADCMDLRTSAGADDRVAAAVARWERDGRPVRREDGVVADRSQYRYRFDPALKRWLRAEVERIERHLASVGYSAERCNQLDGLPRYDGDALVITVTGTNATAPDMPSIVLGLRLEHPGAAWTYLTGGATVPTAIHPTRTQAFDRVTDLARAAAVAATRPAARPRVLRPARPVRLARSRRTAAS